MKRAVEHIFTGEVADIVANAYDSSKTMIGKYMKQYTGSTSEDKFISTKEYSVTNIPDATGTLTFYMPHVYKWSNTKFWVFVASNAATSTTRFCGLFEFDSSNGSVVWKGYITMSGTTISGNKTIRAFRSLVYKHTIGTVGTSGLSTTLNGNGTQFISERIAVGARIGFGSTNPTEITTWYEITAITNDTTLTLSGAVNINAGTSYVIEEVRLLVGCTNVTLTNGGVHLIKGLNYGSFQIGGTTIPEATTIDNIRASYLLKDAATTTMTALIGVPIDNMVSNTDHPVYVVNLDTATTVRIFRLNIRASLIVSAGASTSAFLFKTNTSIITPTASNLNNGSIFTVNHGSASGIKSLWFVTTTRIYRCAISSIVDGSNNFISDYIFESPPGGSNTYALTNSLSQVEYDNSLDRIIVPTAIGRFGVYIGEYSTNPFEKYFGTFNNRVKLSTTPIGAVDGFFPSAAATLCIEDGFIFSIPNTTTTTLNWLHILPIGADGFYAKETNQIIITPKLSTPNARKFYRAYVEYSKYIGSYELGSSPETFRMYFRITGIDDNTGSWTEILKSGDLSAYTPSDYIQFMFELDVIGLSCIPARIYGISCLFEDNSTDEHFSLSVEQSNPISKKIAWWFASSFGSAVPILRVRLLDAITGNLILDDDTDSPTSGIFEKTIDGTNWTAYNSTDRTNNTTWIRYTPTSIGDNILVEAYLFLD
jgi:hypothetical protein